MILLRAAQAADAGALAALFTASRGLLDFLPQLHDAAEDRAFIRDHVLTDTRVTLADQRGVPVGFVAERPGEIEHLYVAPDALGQGVGSALLRAVLAHQDEVALWCFAENTRALAFYRHHGFEVIAETDGAANEAKRPDKRLRWLRAGA
jgi:ribosomal protein S18 acetylase RimI-like enzyme